MQLTAATTELEQVRSDSSATVTNAMSALYPHRQKIQSIDSMIIIKERELAALRASRAQAVSDSAAEATAARAAIAQAKTRVRQTSEAIAALELQSVIQQKKKKRIETDGITKGEQFKTARATHASKLNRYLGLISDKKQKIAQLSAELSAAENTLSTVQGVGVRSSTAAAPQQKSSVNSSSTAQAMIEKIYTLMGENKMAEARSLFNSQKSQLKIFASAEAIKMLESSF